MAKLTDLTSAGPLTGTESVYVVQAGQDRKVAVTALRGGETLHDGRYRQLSVLVPLNEVSGLVSALGAKADLVGGKVPSHQLPAVAIGEVHSVNSQAAMLALTAYLGDVAIRTDQNANRYLLVGDDPSVLSNWHLLTDTVSGGVTSVNGYTGQVVLSAADLGALTQATGDARYRRLSIAIEQSDVAGLQTALNAKLNANDSRLTSGSAGEATVRSISTTTPQPPGTATPGTATNAASGTHVHARQTNIVNSEVSASAAIAESKLALASDGNANDATRRTLGTGAQQAAAGNHGHTGMVTSTTVATIVKLTQAAYDALTPPRPASTLYVIVEA
jgi:hypothetical protein